MSMYGVNGKPIEEAKRVKGQEYENITVKTINGGDAAGDISAGGGQVATNSTGKGGVLDSVAQNHIQDLDVEKEKEILDSKDILQEYSLYLQGKIEKAIEQYGDQTKSQLEKRMVEDLSQLEMFESDPNKRIALIIDEYYGGKFINDDISDEEKVKAIKRVLRLRLNYVNKITSLMSEMLRKNYKLLGLSEEQAKIYIDSLKSGDNKSTKAAGDILKLIKDNGNKFLTNKGQSVDLRPLGFGVILGPATGYELGFLGTDFTNKDAMLNMIQAAMRYDIVVIAHGSDDAENDDEESKEIMRYFKRADVSFHEDQEELIKKLESLSKDDRQDVYTIVNTSKVIYKSVDAEEFMEDEVREILKNPSESAFKTSILKAVDNFYNINEFKTALKNMYQSSGYGEDVIKQVLDVFDSKKEFIEPMIKIVLAEVLMIKMKIELLYSLKGETKGHWGCQPTKTLKAGPFDNVDDLVRQIIKEGYKKILIKDCNPGGHKLAKDIMDTKGVIINYSNFSNYVESSITDDEDLITINEAELSLKEFAASYDIDYDNDEYLEECYQWCIDNIDIIEEGALDTLKEFFKKIVTGIIAFLKKIFSYIKSVFNKFRALFRGSKEEQKDTTTKFIKPIKTPLIDISSEKIVEINSLNRDDLIKDSTKICTDLANKIKTINQKHQSSLKRIEADINKLSSGISNESYEDFMSKYFLEDTDLLDGIFEYLHEFEVEGEPSQEDDEEEEFSIGDEEGVEDTEQSQIEDPPTEETPVEGSEEEEEFSMDDEGGEGSEDQAEPAEANETPTEETPAEDGEEEEEFSMDDESSEGEEGSEDTEQPAEGGEEEENFELPDDESGEQPAEGGEEEEFSMDDEGGEGSEDQSADDSQMDDSQPEDETNTKLKELEAVVFDDLSDDEKNIKITELKALYITVYKKCGSIADMLTGIRRDEETIQIVEYISNTLIDLKEYVNDYINKVFDVKTYVENLAQLQKYIMIFNAISKVFDQIKAENEE